MEVPQYSIRFVVVVSLFLCFCFTVRFSKCVFYRFSVFVLLSDSVSVSF